MEYKDEEGDEEMEREGKVEVMMKGEYYFIREKKKKKVEELREEGKKMEIEKEKNKGKQKMNQMMIKMNMGEKILRMKVEE